MKKRVFLGTSKKSYSLIIREDVTKRSQKISRTIDCPKSKHNLSLMALFEALRAVDENDIVIFYPNYDLISFEWEKEWKINQEFSSETEDIEIWKEIIKIVKNKKIDLVIKDSNSALSAYGRFK